MDDSSPPAQPELPTRAPPRPVSDEPDGSASRRLWALTACGGAFIFVIAALAPFHIVPWLPRRKYGALPWMPTSARRVNRALDSLPASFTKPGRRFVDLGSGDGVAVIEAAKRGMIAHGVELNPTLVALSKVLAWHGGVSGQATFELGNMFAHGLRGYSVIMVFGVIPLMARVGAKIEAEVEGPVCIISHKFPLPSDPWGPRCVSVIDDMHVYRFEPLPRSSSVEQDAQTADGDQPQRAFTSDQGPAAAAAHTGRNDDVGRDPR